MNAWNCGWVNGEYSEMFGMGVGVHQGSAHYSSSWCWKRFCMSYTLTCCGSFFMLMTWCSLQTPRRNGSPNSRWGRLAWKEDQVPGLWCWPWCPKEIPQVPLCCLLQWCWQQLHRVLPMQAVAPQEVHAVASLDGWWLTQTMSGTCVTARLDQLITEMWLRWMLMALCLMWRPPSATQVRCCALMGSVRESLPPDAARTGESSGNSYLSYPPDTSHLMLGLHRIVTNLARIYELKNSGFLGLVSSH